MTTNPLADNRCPNCNSPDIEWKDEYHLGWHCKLCGSSFYRPIERPRQTGARRHLVNREDKSG